MSTTFNLEKLLKGIPLIPVYSSSQQSEILEPNQKEDIEKKEKEAAIIKYLLAYLFYDEDNIEKALRLGFDPLTGAKIERRYIGDMQHSPGGFVLGYYEPDRKTLTLPYEHERGKGEVINTFLHEISHAMGSVHEPSTEAYAQDVLKKQYQQRHYN